MKRILIATLTLAVFASLGFAADEQKDQKKKSPPKKSAQAQQAQPAARATSNSQRQVQTQSQRQQTTSNVRQFQSNAGPARNARTSSRTQSQTTSNIDARANTRSQTINRGVQSTNAATVNRNNSQVISSNRNVASRSVNRTVVRNTSNRHFVRSVSGPRVSFTTARQFNWRTRHDRGWWNSHYNRFVIYGGGYYFWNNGWWYPAYGYNPYYNSYPYDGPIFGYGYAAPGDVTGQVQQVLAQQGYYRGPIDGILGPGTRDAIAQWQADHGLIATAAIDEQTLGSLGLA
jgi:Putative peptidoglycan binding domain